MISQGFPIVPKLPPKISKWKENGKKYYKMERFQPFSKWKKIENFQFFYKVVKSGMYGEHANAP